MCDTLRNRKGYSENRRTLITYWLGVNKLHNYYDNDIESVLEFNAQSHFLLD